MNKLAYILLTYCIIWISYTQSCISKNGEPVSWWIQLIYPKTVQDQYAYFDSNFMTDKFQSQSEPADSINTAFHKTLQQINQLKLQYLVWNDQLPNGTTSSVKAHSKGLLAFDDTQIAGFYFGHSIPMFPDFQGILIKTSISQGQRTYGQHAFCITLNGIIVQQIKNKILPMRPYIYASNLKQYSNEKLSQIDPPDYISLFTNQSYISHGINYKFIFKNGGLNGSLFEDGLNNLFKSGLLVQSWGRPIQQPWCGSIFSVGNIETLKINNNSFWKRTQDHSKWAFVLESEYSCFGDANRMQSQWKRGGGFYCIQSPKLKQALKSIINETNTCLLNYSNYLAISICIFLIFAFFI